MATECAEPPMKRRRSDFSYRGNRVMWTIHQWVDNEIILEAVKNLSPKNSQPWLRILRETSETGHKHMHIIAVYGVKCTVPKKGETMQLEKMAEV